MKRFGVAVGTIGVVGVLATGLAATAQAQDDPHDRTACTPQPLPVPADIGSDETVYLEDADPSGRYILGALWGGPGLLWVDGELETKLTGLPDLEGYEGFYGINSSGVVVGVTEPGNDGYTPWKYEHESGEYTDLPGPANELWDINENGDILGTISNRRTMIWSGEDSNHQQELPGNVTGNAISEEGVVIGSDYEDASGNYISYYWPDPNQAPQRLDNPTGVRSSTVGEIVGDWVIGYDQTTDDSDAGILWNLADGSVEKLPYQPSAVNSAGDIGSDGKLHLADGSTLELPAPDGASGKPDVETVTEPGSEFAATGTYLVGDVERPLTWTC